MGDYIPLDHPEPTELGVMYRYFDCIREPARYIVIKKTRAGKRILLHFSNRTKFVLDNALRRYGHETRDAALKAHIARKKRQIKLLEGNLSNAKQALYQAEKLKEG